MLHRSCPLVKEWREVMTEVGDHQSLVASLKQAAYFHLFKVAALPGLLVGGIIPMQICLEVCFTLMRALNLRGHYSM